MQLEGEFKEEKFLNFDLFNKEKKKKNFLAHK